MLRSFSTLLGLSTLVLAVPAFGQDATVTLDLFSVDQTTCGELVAVTAVLESPDAPSVGPVTYELPYPPGITPDFDPAITSSPLIVNLATPLGGERPQATVVEGLDPGDTRLLLEIESLCFEGCTPLPPTNLVTMTFRTDATLRGQLGFTGTISGPDFPTVADSHTVTVDCDTFPLPKTSVRRRPGRSSPTPMATACPTPGIASATPPASRSRAAPPRT